MKNSNIEWTDHTFNPWIGCTKVSPGCDHCYAEARMDKRLHRVQWGPGNPRQRTSEAYWKQPLTWNADHETFFAEHGRRQRVFCASLADVFDNEVPVKWRADLFRLMRSTPHLDWLLLTKRVGNAKAMITEARDFDAMGPIWPWPNVWIGATIVNQEEADRDIPKLLATPAAKRFLSMEPLLGPVNLERVEVPTEQDQLRRPWDTDGSKFNALRLHDDDRFHQPPAKLDWVIVGGESGPGARPMHPDWATSLRDQCQAAGVPFLFKQWGEWAPTAREPIHPEALKRPGNLCRVEHINQPDHYAAVSFTGNTRYHIERVGKKAAGRTLDGRTWDEVPA